MAQRRTGLNELAFVLWHLVRRLDGGRPRIDVDEMPGRQRPFGVKAGLRFDHRCGPEICPRKLLGPGPTQRNGLARCLREPRRLDGGLPGVLAAEPGPEIRNNDPHLVVGNMKRAGQLAAMSEWILCAGPDG